MKKLICILLIMINTLLGFGCWDLGFCSDYTLAPGDQLEVRLIGQKDLDTKQTIAPDGSISLPLVSRVIAEGKTLKSLNEYLVSEYSKYVKNPQVVISLTPRPIYVIQHDVRKNTWDVKEAKSITEAMAYAGVGTGLVPVRNIKYGDVVSVEVSTRPDFWEENWYKVLTATAVAVGIYATVHR